MIPLISGRSLRAAAQSPFLLPGELTAEIMRRNFLTMSRLLLMAALLALTACSEVGEEMLQNVEEAYV
uniref:Uncharacterized protein n=1 Tax=Pyxicephalus adspersus TaxID=30357 RepID=A0AAV3AIM4_PYXAD|nr:TPA: hypothetical protein GDO54_013006 [Pyxicephalus adspersus]